MTRGYQVSWNELRYLCCPCQYQPPTNDLPSNRPRFSHVLQNHSNNDPTNHGKCPRTVISNVQPCSTICSYQIIWIYIYIYPAPKVLDPVPAFLQHLVLLDDTDLLLRGYRLRSRLHDVELAIVAIAGPLDVLPLGGQPLWPWWPWVKHLGETAGELGKTPDNMMQDPSV